MSTATTISIFPQEYIHVLDNNTNLTRLIEGPKIFTKAEHEKIVLPSTKMISLPPRNYCMVKDPVQLPLTDPIRQIFGKIETRTYETHPKPFPLYPGEKLVQDIQPYITIQANCGLKLKAKYDLIKNERKIPIGTKWIIKGPDTYIPQSDEEILGIVKAEIIKPNTALKLKAKKNTLDYQGNKRFIGEQWLVRRIGAYLPQAYEEVIGIVKGQVLNEKTALKLRALNYFTDAYGKERKPGQQWLITSEIAQVHIQDIYEEIVETLSAITLDAQQYCVVSNPYDVKLGKNAWGVQQLRKGEQTFFLYQNEVIEDGIKFIYHLPIFSKGEDQALLLLAEQEIVDFDGIKHMPGEKWMIKGPCEYVPPVEVTIVEERSAIPLDQNEGIYIRDTNTGEIRSFKGSTYLLQSHEILWQKELPEEVEKLLAENNQNSQERNQSKMVTYKAPHNSAVQLYNLATDEARVVFGPELILLEPDEVFTVLTLSGGKPKKEGQIKILALGLGPDFMTDIVIVETLDHARLSLKLSYNWYFRFDKKNPQDQQKLFSVKVTYLQNKFSNCYSQDFVGDACKTIASRVRGSVSTVTFEYFHHHSSDQIKESVFGKTPVHNRQKDGQFKKELFFPSNNLCISSVDIQAVEITDQKTREMLSKSINLAIEISSKSQEANSKHEAERMEQIARGQLERQKLEAAATAEKAKIQLLELEAQSESVKKKGDAVAIAQAQAEGALISGQAEIEQAELQVQALTIEADAEIAELQAKNSAEIEHLKGQMELELNRATQMAEIEINKFTKLVESIGKDTIVEISKAGPELKAKLLQSLGLQGYLITDGKSPINLFQTAEGFIKTQQ